MKLLQIILVGVCALLAMPVLAQEKFALRIVQVDSAEGVQLSRLVQFSPSYASPSERANALQNGLATLRASGYLTASVDQLHKDSLSQTAHIFVGKLYSWGRLSPGNVDGEILAKSGFRERLFRGKALNVPQINQLLESVLRWCENNGHPFASVQLDSLNFAENGVHASLRLKKNQTVYIDSVDIVGDARVSPVYLYSYLGIRPGDLYNESAVQRVQTRLSELALVKVIKPPEVIFQTERTTLRLYLDHARASLLNGIVGFLPDANTGEILFTGDVQLKLLNSLGRGETFDLNWKKTQANTVDFRLNAAYPFVLNTPFGLDGTFFLLRRDTLYTDLRQTLAIKYHLTGGNFLKAYVISRTLALLSTTQYANATRLPEFGDARTISYGLGLLSERLDYRFNPTRGFSAELEASLGTKEIRQNPNLPTEVYENIELRSVQLNSMARLRWFLPVRSRGTVMLGNQTGLMQGDNIFENELFRIGGLKTLRGFDEESIFASLYSIGTLELRYLLERNSYAYLFGDAAYVEATSTTEFRVLRPFGFGAGVSFETRAGIFSINYALGKIQGNPIELRSGKIHFGFVNLF